jgi:hypothetical protein
MWLLAYNYKERDECFISNTILFHSIIIGEIEYGRIRQPMACVADFFSFLFKVLPFRDSTPKENNWQAVENQVQNF